MHFCRQSTNNASTTDNIGWHAALSRAFFSFFFRQGFLVDWSHIPAYYTVCIHVHDTTISDTLKVPMLTTSMTRQIKASPASEGKYQYDAMPISVKREKEKSDFPGKNMKCSHLDAFISFANSRPRRPGMVGGCSESGNPPRQRLTLVRDARR